MCIISINTVLYCFNIVALYYIVAKKLTFSFSADIAAARGRPRHFWREPHFFANFFKCSTLFTKMFITLFIEDIEH